MGAYEQWCSVQANESRQHLDHWLETDGPCDIDGQAFARELVDDRQALDLLTAGRGVEDEVMGPDHVGLNDMWMRGRADAMRLRE